MAEERGMRVDMGSFNAALEEAKEKSRSAAKKGGERGITFEAEATAELAKRGVKPTDERAKYVWNAPVAATVRALITPSGFVDVVTPDTEGPIGAVLDCTGFYAESGGQTFDTGALAAPGAGGATLLEVSGCITAAGYVLHTGERAAARLAVGDAVASCVDYGRRGRVAPNHTLTHVLNLALRETLGDHIDQKGSLVDADKLRFDFSHPRAVEPAELAAVEAKVRAVVEAKVGVHAKEVPLAAAKAICGLRAVFGEVYPDPVRVVSVGATVEELLAAPDNAAWKAQSIEFCGGTHLSNTGDAAAFALLSEEGIAKGIRRIVGVTGDAAAAAIGRAQALRQRVAEVAALPDAALEKELAAIKRASLFFCDALFFVFVCFCASIHPSHARTRTPLLTSCLRCFPCCAARSHGCDGGHPGAREGGAAGVAGGAVQARAGGGQGGRRRRQGARAGRRVRRGGRGGGGGRARHGAALRRGHRRGGAARRRRRGGGQGRRRGAGERGRGEGQDDGLRGRPARAGGGGAGLQGVADRGARPRRRQGRRRQGRPGAGAGVRGGQGARGARRSARLRRRVQVSSGGAVAGHARLHVGCVL
jgi:Ser-tRNA(Ala) deacylase AlaX